MIRQPGGHPLFIVIFFLFLVVSPLTHVLSSTQNPADTKKTTQESPQKSLPNSLDEEQEKISDLASKLNQMEDERYERRSAIDDAQQRLLQSEGAIQEIQQEEAAQKSQIYEAYTAMGSQQAQREASASVDLTNTQDEMKQSTARLQELGQQVQQLEAKNMETDELVAAQAEYQKESEHLQQLEGSYRDLKAEAGEAAFQRQRAENWVQQDQYKQLQSNFQAQLEQAQSSREAAKGDYDRLVREDKQQTTQINSTAEEFNTLRDDYTARQG